MNREIDNLEHLINAYCPYGDRYFRLPFCAITVEALEKNIESVKPTGGEL